MMDNNEKRKVVTQMVSLFFIFVFDATIKNHLLFARRASEWAREEERNRGKNSFWNDIRTAAPQRTINFNLIEFICFCHPLLLLNRMICFCLPITIARIELARFKLLFLLYFYFFLSFFLSSSLSLSPLSICRSNNNSIKLFVIANRPLRIPKPTQAKPNQTM